MIEGEENLSDQNLLIDENSESEIAVSDDEREHFVNLADVQTIQHGPNQPVLTSYPITLTSGKNRSFQSSWYKSYPWLEYDQEKNKASCFSCANFGRESDKKFSYSAWGIYVKKKTLFFLRRLKTHEKSKAHEKSMIAWIASKTKSHSEANLLSQMKTKHKEEIDQNRLYLQKIIESLIFVARQNIAMRSHSECRTDIGSSSDTNRGNFLETLNLRCKDVPWLRKKLDDSLKKQHQWTSPSIQNEILSIISKLVLDHIVDQIKAAGPYSIIANETYDISNSEQVSLYIRIVTDGEIQEKFIGFMEAPSTTGQSLFSLIKGALVDQTLDLGNIVGQGYDGASNMSSARVGVSGLMMQEAPRAIYIHCYGHQLNLSTQRSMTMVISFRNCLGTTQEVFNFIEASPKRHALFKETQKQRSEKEITLKSQSKIRWACRKEATSALLRRLPSALQTLLNVNENDPKLMAKCNGLIRNILTFDFIFSLVIVDEVLGLIDGLSKYLQSENMDVHTAKQSAISVIATMKALLHEDSFNNSWEKTSTIASEMGQIISGNHQLDFQEPSIPRNSLHKEIKPYYKEAIYDDGINCAISELESRFDKDSQSVLCALSKIVMKPMETDIETEANIVSNFYDIDKSSLLAERKIASASIALQKQEDILTASHKLIKWLHVGGIGDIIPTFKAAAIILATIPATSCSAERSFSALRRIKTYLRNTMKEERLSAVAILNIERETTNFIEANHMDKIIDEFAKKNEVRAKLLIHDP